ncbi:hypothetical protein [Streptomyces sp. SCUT-3]|uniref:hypothetical protein n=1 Tax=Streptomyces sp. SCUT-3 TaxID=2684469 RepID=UPI0015FA2224|nr:hypothetical protein [Streptomyces sp. SCUT-3]
MASEQTPQDRPDEAPADTGAAPGDAGTAPEAAGSGTDDVTSPSSAAATASGPPRRRRSRATVAAVAAAVLLAGGGSAYWAATADGGPAGSSSPAAGGERPEPLRIDGPPGAGGPPGQIAPGEPDPNGAVYRATGKLPEGPDSAHVYTTAGKVPRQDVVRLAKALGLKGSPRLADGTWSLPGDPGEGPSLQVTEGSPGNWTFSRPGATGGDPVSAERAERAAAPLWKALGLQDPEVDASATSGAVRTVTASPEVGGLPTEGREAGAQIGPDGEVVSAHGMLAALQEKPGAYPVISAKKALELLNAGAPGDDLGIASCPSAPVPPPSDPKKEAPGPGEVAPCVPSKAPVQEVRGARFGLSAQSVEGRQALVPSWLFDVAQPGVERTHPVAQIAVDPRYLDVPPQEDPSAPAGGDVGAGAGTSPEPLSYSADGRTLTLYFWGGVCNTYRAVAEESADRVTVEISGRPDRPDRACIMIAERTSVEVRLDEPLGDRAVVEAGSGDPVPARSGGAAKEQGEDAR